MNIVRKLNLMIPWSIFLLQILLFSLQGKNSYTIFTLFYFILFQFLLQLIGIVSSYTVKNFDVIRTNIYILNDSQIIFLKILNNVDNLGLLVFVFSL